MAAGLDRETLALILDSIGAFAAEHLPDARLLELDRTDEFPVDTVREMCTDLGISLLFIDEEYGGMSGGAFDVYRVCEAISGVDLGVATGVLATFLGSDPIIYGGTPEQKKRWMTAIAEEGLLMAYGATEPAAGSDLGALKTVAVPVIEGGETVGYKISGAKQWISNGGYADLYTILAKTPAGPTWFVVDKGTEGFSAGKPEEKHGIRASNTAALSLDEVYVTPDRVIGGVEGQGLRQAQLVFGYTRLMVAAFGLGAGWSALDRAIPYSVDRLQGGSPLSEKQGYTHKLIVPHAVHLEASRAYIERSAAALDRGEGAGGALNTEGAIAKYLATEAGNQAADAAIQALGGYGYTHEYMVEKTKRDVRITTIYEGTSEIMEMTVARDRWQQHLKTRGAHYHDQARDLEALHRRSPGVGADIAALGLHALAATMERCRLGRLTRQQHVLFRLGKLICQVEGAAVFADKAARLAAGDYFDKSPARFDAATTARMARIYAREAALDVALEGVRWVTGGAGASDLPAFERELGLSAIYAAQAGLLEDMDRVADAIYDRA